MNKYLVKIGLVTFHLLVFPHHRAILVHTADVMRGSKIDPDGLRDAIKREAFTTSDVVVEWSEERWTADDKGMSRVARVRVIK